MTAERAHAATPADDAPALAPRSAASEPFALAAAGGLSAALARASRTSPHARAATLASLQRSVGNGAIARAVPQRALARYEAGEHALFGGPGRTLKIGEVEITEAELQAMGDFYKDPEAMVADAKANKGAFQALRDRIRDDRTLREQGKKGLEEKAWIDATAHRPKGETYLELASKNISHFAPGKGPVNNKTTWEALHRRALEQAQRDKKASDEAAMLNAFAGHFLTDAFAAGHMVAKPEIMEQAGTKFDAMPTTGLVAKENDFSKALGKGLMADPKVAAELAKWQLRVATWGEFTPERLSEVIFGMRAKAPDDFLSLFARVVHDQLDDAIKAGKDKGLEVTNDNGDIWTLSGDETLNLSADTQFVAGRAVEASRKNLEIAASSATLDHAALFANVWRFVPRPTTKAEHDAALKALAAATSTSQRLLAPGARPGWEQMNDVVGTFTDPTRPETVAAIVKLAASKLDAVIDQLRQKGYAQPKPPPRPARDETRPMGSKI
jgi:hypothetical protein